MSKVQIGKKHSPEHIKNAIDGRKNHNHSDKTKSKMKATAKKKSTWLHENGYKCNCRECLDRKNNRRKFLKTYIPEIIWVGNANG